MSLVRYRCRPAVYGSLRHSPPRVGLWAWDQTAACPEFETEQASTALRALRTRLEHIR